MCKLSQGDANAKRVISARFFCKDEGLVAVEYPGCWIQMHIMQ